MDDPPSFPFVGTKRECSTISNIKQPSRTCSMYEEEEEK
jgi:hypothetical protein